MSHPIIIFFLLIISCSNSTYDIHFNSFVADMHNDILLRAMQGDDILSFNPDTHSDLQKLRSGGVDLQAFSIWVSPNEFSDREYFNKANDMINKLEYLCSRAPNQWSIIKNYQDINYNQKKGILSCLIGVEGGHVLGNDLKNVEYLYTRGMRYLGLTWNNSNLIASSAKDESMEDLEQNKFGLTKYGEDVISECNRLGILIDISHAGEKTFWDVIKITKSPIIASHSSVYNLCPHYRNLKDDQLLAIKNNGGAVFVNFYPGYIDSTYSKKAELVNLDYKYERSKLADTLDTNSTKYWYAESKLLEKAKSKIVPEIDNVIDHIDYISSLIGVEHVGLGSDFDGVEIMPVGLENVTKLPFITKKLLDRGYSTRDIRKILGGNFKRIFREVNN